MAQVIWDPTPENLATKLDIVLREGRIKTPSIEPGMLQGAEKWLSWHSGMAQTYATAKTSSQQLLETGKRMAADNLLEVVSVTEGEKVGDLL